MRNKIQLNLSDTNREFALDLLHRELALTKFFSYDKFANRALSIYQELLS
jgi:hypothetical protein